MPPSFPILCSWCGLEVGRSEVPHSHGICRACSAQLLGVPLLTEAELDALPFGVIGLDATGVVTSYNQAEQRLSGLDAPRVVGRHFFREVAPCTAVKAFQGRFEAFLASGEGRTAFEFTFLFPARTTRVTVAFVRRDLDTAQVLVRAHPSSASDAAGARLG